MTNKEAAALLLQIPSVWTNERHQVAIDKARVLLINTPDPERWRDAEWPRDASNPPKEAMFRDDEIGGCIPKDGLLVGFHGGYWYDEKFDGWKFCQVRDE